MWCVEVANWYVGEVHILFNVFICQIKFWFVRRIPGVFFSRPVSTYVLFLEVFVHLSGLAWDIIQCRFAHCTLYRGYLGTFIMVHPIICHRLFLFSQSNCRRNATAVGGNACWHICCMWFLFGTLDAIPIAVPCPLYHLTHRWVASRLFNRPRNQPQCALNNMGTTIAWDATPAVSVSHFIPYQSAPNILPPSFLLSSSRFSEPLHTPVFPRSNPQLPSDILPIPFFITPLPSILIFLPNHSNLFSVCLIASQIRCINGEMIRCGVIIEHHMDGFRAASHFGLCFASRSGALILFFGYPFVVLPFVWRWACFVCALVSSISRYRLVDNGFRFSCFMCRSRFVEIYVLLTRKHFVQRHARGRSPLCQHMTISLRQLRFIMYINQVIYVHNI